MARSGYDGDCDGWALICWRGAVASAIRGKRGQAFLREMLEALDALSEKRLIEDELKAHGEVCAIGSVGVRRGTNMANVDPYDRDALAAIFGIAPALAAEIMDENDRGWQITPEQRWQRVRNWVSSKIHET